MKLASQKSINQKIPEPIKKAMQLLNENNFAAYLVGGSVRDLLLQKTPSDYDIATEAKPEQTKDVFKNFSVIPTGVRYGTVTVIIEDQKIEITTYRIEADYNDYRRPSQVQYTDQIKEDLARRDFTINALAYHPEDGLLDFFGGQSDLENKLIRAVGKPIERFEEDPLRILRTLRFAARLNFSVEKETAKAMFICKHLLLKISKERIQQEFIKIITATNIKKILLMYRDIFAIIVPAIAQTFDFEQHHPYHIFDVYTHTVEVVTKVPTQLDLRLAAFYHDIAKPGTFSLDENGVGHFYGHPKLSAEIAKQSLRELKFDKKTIKQVTLLVEHHDIPIWPEKKLIKKRLARFGEETFFKLITLQKADVLGQAKTVRAERLAFLNQIEELAKTILKEKPSLDLKDLKIDGYDALALGLSGPQIGRALNQCLTAIIDEEIKNEREILLDYLNKISAQILKEI